MPQVRSQRIADAREILSNFATLQRKLTDYKNRYAGRDQFDDAHDPALAKQVTMAHALAIVAEDMFNYGPSECKYSFTISQFMDMTGSEYIEAVK